MDKIDHLDLQQWVQGTLSARLKNKTIRDIISNVREVFKLYRTRKRVAHDPTEGLQIRLPDPAVPDPFTRTEIEQIMATPTNRTFELLMVQFMIWAGPRVSETLALAWEDVDLQAGTVTFRRSKVRGEYRVTKTRRSTRKVRLIKPALEALQKLRALTQKPVPHHVDIVERDNRTVRRHKLHFVFLIRPVANRTSVTSPSVTVSSRRIWSMQVFATADLANVATPMPVKCSAAG